jgi:hypothetical protein
MCRHSEAPCCIVAPDEYASGLYLRCQVRSELRMIMQMILLTNSSDQMPDAQPEEDGNMSRQNAHLPKLEVSLEVLPRKSGTVSRVG